MQALQNFFPCNLGDLVQFWLIWAGFGRGVIFQSSPASACIPQQLGHARQSFQHRAAGNATRQGQEQESSYWDGEGARHPLQAAKHCPVEPAEVAGERDEDPPQSSALCALRFLVKLIRFNKVPFAPQLLHFFLSRFNELLTPKLLQTSDLVSKRSKNGSLFKFTWRLTRTFNDSWNRGVCSS